MLRSYPDRVENYGNLACMARFDDGAARIELIFSRVTDEPFAYITGGGRDKTYSGKNAETDARRAWKTRVAGRLTK